MASRSLGTLTLDLALRLGAFSEGLDKAQRESSKRMKAIKADAEQLGKEIAVAMTAAAGAFAVLVKSAIDTADDMSKLAQSTGLTTEAISQLQYAAGLSGVEDLGTSLVKFNKSIAEAATGSKAQAEAFAALGVNIKNADGSLKDTETLLTETAEAFSGFEDGAAKTTVAMDLFGKTGASLIPLLNSGAAGLAEMRAEANAFGLTLTEETGKSAEAFNDNLSRMQEMFKGVALQTAAEMLPAMEGLSNIFVETLKDTEAIDKAMAGLAATFKIVVSAGIVTKNAFEVLGKTLGGVSAYLVSLFKGDFQGAAAIAEQFAQDVTADFTDIFENIDKIWSQSVAKVPEAAKKATEETKKTLVLAGKDIQSAIDKPVKAATTSASKDVVDFTAVVIDNTDQMARAYERAAEGIEGVFRDLYRSAFDGFEGFEDRLKDSFKDLLVELALIATRNAIIIPVVTQLGGAFGLNQQTLSGITGALGLGDQSGLGGLLGNVFGNAGNQFGEHALSVMEAEFPGIGATIGNSAASSIASALQGAGMLGAAAAGLYNAGNALTTTNSNFSAQQQGFAAAATFGYSLMFSAFDKAVGGNLFGTKWKTAGQTLAINIQDDIADATLTTIRSRKRPLGGGTKRRTSTDEVLALDEQISEVFGGIYDSVTSALDDLGIELGEFDFDIKLDTKGKTEEEIQALIQGAINSATEALMLEAIPNLEQFQRVGEELAGTFDRVVKGAGAVNRAIDLFDLNTMVPFLGMRELVFEFNEALGLWTVAWRESTKVVEASPEQILAVSDALTVLAGGAEQLATNINGFFNAFATDAQKFDASQRQVTKLFDSLGIAVPQSSADLFNLVSGLDLFSEAGQQAFNAITAAYPLLSDFFGSIEDFASDAYDIRTRLGRNDGLDPLRDALEAIGLTLEQFQNAARMDHPLARIRIMLDRLNDRDLASLGPFIDDILGLVNGVTAAGQNANLAAAESELRRAYDIESNALRSAAESFQRIVDSLRDFQRDLSTGPLARLTPQQQYAALSSEFRDVSALARAGDEEALGRLPDVAREFLEASQANFASSSRYFADLASVQDVIGDAVGAAEFEVDMAQRQLDRLDAQVGELININESVKSVAEAIRELREIQNQQAKDTAALTNSQTQLNKRMDVRMKQISDAVSDISRSQRLESARA